MGELRQSRNSPIFNWEYPIFASGAWNEECTSGMLPFQVSLNRASTDSTHNDLILQ
jgi:hypothetical protein